MNNQSPLKLGILGGGQLGMMLIEALRIMNEDGTFERELGRSIKVKVLDGDPHASCSTTADEFIVGKLTDFDAVYNFGKSVDLLTIEIENVNIEALHKLMNEGLKIYPQPHVLQIIQDKGDQKLFYQEFRIPTAPFRLIENKQQLLQYKGPFPVVQKSRKAGYDGRGVFIIKSPEDLKNGFEQPSLLETFAQNALELAVIVTRSRKGEMTTFPAIEMEFHPSANMVDFLIAPARITPEIESKAEKIAKDIASAFNIVGNLAVEFFLLPDGTIWVNEVAPRPHNSGHHTIEANETSQYAQQLRAILGMKLGFTTTKKPAVMVNLVGEKGYEGEAKYVGLDEVKSMSETFIHLYQKKITKPFRKMGHVTVLDEDVEKALMKAKKIKSKLKIIA